MDRSILDDESAPFQRESKDFVGSGLLGNDPHDEHTGGTQEFDQPIKRDIKASKRAPPPINQGYVVLARRVTAVCGGCRLGIAATMQIQHQLDGLGPGYDDSVPLRAACKRNHWFNDEVAYGSGTGGSHDVTILI
jgi:hypothetical protein